MHRQIHLRLRVSKKVFLLSALVLFLCATTSRAQEPDEPVEVIRTNLVQLNVGVADRRGQAVTDLSLNDFKIYEDGVPQSIVSFEPTTAPFSLVLLLDMSGSTLSFRTTLKQSALRFIDALAPDDRVAVVSFNDKIKTLQSFTTDRQKIAFAIAELAEGRGQSDVFKALSYSLDQLAKEGKRRKAVVVLTDGVDTEMRRADGVASASATTNSEAIAAVKPETSPSLRAVLDRADAQGVTVFPLVLPGGDPKRFPALTPQQAAIYAAARARVEVLAARTGGRLHDIRRLEDLGRMYAEVAAEMRTLYSIAYQPSGTRPRDGSWRAINIEVRRAELIARTRPGYFAYPR